jgi:glycosyltransferase involved in cell wall biosynthesis
MASSTHLVLIPSYNSGPRLRSTVVEALAKWCPVWVVIDGSNDGSERALDDLATNEPDLRVLRRPYNGGKGAAVLTGIEAAAAAGFTHVLTMDADGQHPADRLRPFMELSQTHPDATIFGVPVFGPEAPLARLQGRKLSVALVRWETWGPRQRDPLFGFRVYPIAALRTALAQTRCARGYDFDPEVAVRLMWAGVRGIDCPAPCRYLTAHEGGISHFRYLRDNAKMIWLHTRLLAHAPRHWPRLWRQRRTRATASFPS